MTMTRTDSAAGNPRNDAPAAAGGRLRHSACRWCYESIPLDAFCAAGKAMGLESVELLMPADFPTLRRHGLACAITSFPVATVAGIGEVGGITRAFNRLEHHDALVPAYEALIAAAAAAGVERVICFSGNRDGMSDRQGLENCATGLRRLLPVAERHGVGLVMELLNSKTDHPGYMCDHTAWGVELCEQLGSPWFGLLYDIYHMQIMEGDVIATIRRHHRWFRHYHTGGVPGRHEIDGTQELNYPAIMRAIADTGYRGFVGQEFIPQGADPLRSLRAALAVCTV